MLAEAVVDEPLLLIVVDVAVVVDVADVVVAVTVVVVSVAVVMVAAVSVAVLEVAEVVEVTVVMVVVEVVSPHLRSEVAVGGTTSRWPSVHTVSGRHTGCAKRVPAVTSKLATAAFLQSFQATHSGSAWVSSAIRLPSGHGAHPRSRVLVGTTS
jgi:hypothetical protein